MNHLPSIQNSRNVWAVLACNADLCHREQQHYYYICVAGWLWCKILWVCLVTGEITSLWTSVLSGSVWSLETLRDLMMVVFKMGQRRGLHYNPRDDSNLILRNAAMVNHFECLSIWGLSQNIISCTYKQQKIPSEDCWAKEGQGIGREIVPRERLLGSKLFPSF